MSKFKGYGGWKGKNKWVTVGGIKFPSKREADHWVLLSCRQEEGTITMLRRQVRFEITVPHCITGTPTTLATYVADYAWIDAAGSYCAADAKPLSMVTPEAALKLKMMDAILGIKVQLV